MKNFDRNKLKKKAAAEMQLAYYTENAALYDSRHVKEQDEHFFALSALLGLLDFFDIRSILDIGSGTGRALLFIKDRRPDIRVVGIEPVAALREVGYKSGLTKDELIDGDAFHIDFDNSAFDLVCEFGMLHHVGRPSSVVEEMLRVSNKAIFISDNNNFGHGSSIGRVIKQIVNAFGLWQAASWLKNGGSHHFFTEGDGLAYSYSVFNNFRQIKNSCKAIHILNTSGLHKNQSIYRSASHVALLGLK